MGWSPENGTRLNLGQVRREGTSPWLIDLEPLADTSSDYIYPEHGFHDNGRNNVSSRERFNRTYW